MQQYNKNRRNMKTNISLKIIRTTNEELSGSSISVVKKKKKKKGTLTATILKLFLRMKSSLQSSTHLSEILQFDITQANLYVTFRI